MIDTYWYNRTSMCEACPFNVSEAQEMAYNLGCLPTIPEIMELCADNDISWSCHEKDGKLCTGYAAVCRDQGIDYKHRPLLSTSTYLRTGDVIKHVSGTNK